MSNAESIPRTKLRILHCFRSPVGGIFRHVRDLIEQQVAEGHSVGVICDNNTGGSFEENLLAELATKLELGLFRVPMKRAIGPRDIKVSWQLYKTIKSLDADILHSHGAKGGAYARFIGSLLRLSGSRPARLYCPHGGSVHYDGNTLSGRVYFALERLLERMTDRLIFVSEYERSAYFKKVGQPHCPDSLVRNGLAEWEFEPVIANSDAADFLYIGMMRDLKGVDLFLGALDSAAKALDRPVSAVLVGDGPDLESYKKQAINLGPLVTTTFHEPMAARKAFKLAKCTVVPSRAESMPYIVLEATAARVPLIATRVGGIPEIFGEYSGALVEPGSEPALSRAMVGQLNQTLKMPDPEVLAKRVYRDFSAPVMAEDVMRAYRACFKTR